MARSVRSVLETRSARLRLAAGQVHWQRLHPGIAIGYRRPDSGGAGVWWIRVRIAGRYLVNSLEVAADDHAASDGRMILSWREAQIKVLDRAKQQTHDGPTTVETLIELYLADLRARKGDQAAHEAGLTLARHFLPAFRGRRPADLVDSDIRTWRNELVNNVRSKDGPKRGNKGRDMPLAEGSVEVVQLRRAQDSANRILNVVRALLNYGHRTGLIASDLAWRQVKPFRAVGSARKVILTDDEAQRLLDSSGPGLRELNAMGLWTGARWGELANARVRDFDPDSRTLGLNGKTGPRTIHLPTDAVLLLRRLAAGKKPTDYLLIPLNGHRWTENLHRLPFKKAVAKAGLDQQVTFYSLRHSYISRALKHLVPVKALADHTGTSIAMIERHYAKFAQTDRRQYAELAAPQLQIEPADTKIVPLSRGTT
jgi:integrase